jgi:hypothetical protein
MASILIRLPEGFSPPEHLNLPEDAPVVAAIVDDDMASILLKMLETGLELGMVTTPPVTPINPN